MVCGSTARAASTAALTAGTCRSTVPNSEARCCAAAAAPTPTATHAMRKEPRPRVINAGVLRCPWMPVLHDLAGDDGPAPGDVPHRLDAGGTEILAGIRAQDRGPPRGSS